MATVVIPEAPYKVYPGGVIALRCVDYMGTSSTLSTENDSGSVCGVVVRETQKITDMAGIGHIAAFQAAQDSLVIDFSTLPAELIMQYMLVVSYKTEGDWDVSNPYTTQAGTPSTFGYNCSTIRWCGDGYFTLNNPAWVGGYTKRQRSYITVSSGNVFQCWYGTEILRIRAYSEIGTTIEYLLDAVYLIPYQYSLNNGQWGPDDFNIVSGMYLAASEELPDGDDGGDSNGKFTLHPFSDWYTEDDWWWTEPGGGDYQRKSNAASAEYFGTTSADSWSGQYYLWDSRVYPDWGPGSNPKQAECYGIHGAHYIEDSVVVHDTFDRVLYDGDIYGEQDHFIGSNWGDAPGGYGWIVGMGGTGPFLHANGVIEGRAYWVDGDKAWMHISREFQSDFSSASCSFGPSESGNPNKASIADMDNIKVSGKFSTHFTYVAGSSPYMHVFIGLGENASTYRHSPYIDFDCWTRTWTFGLLGTQTILGPYDISSWWTGTEEIGFRVEIERYRVRIRVWNASAGGEPGTWNLDQYRPFIYSLPPYWIDYPYNNDLGIAFEEWDVSGVRLQIGVGSVTLLTPGFRIAWDNVKVETNTLESSPQPVYFSMEKPHGTIIDQIELEPTAQYLVYWGRRDWTVYDDWSQYGVITFSTKAWNDVNAPKMQRAESLLWWFRSVHGGAPKIIRYR